MISHHGKFWQFDNLRLTPRPLQQPSPPVWVTVVSTSSARKAARRGAKISTGFHPQEKVIEIFDAYRDEAAKAGRKAGPDDLCLRRQVVMEDDPEALAKRRPLDGRHHGEVHEALERHDGLHDSAAVDVGCQRIRSVIRLEGHARGRSARRP